MSLALYIDVSGSSHLQPELSRSGREHNAKAFVNACAQQGVPEQALCRPSDAIEGNLSRILDTVQALLATSSKLPQSTV